MKLIFEIEIGAQIYGELFDRIVNSGQLVPEEVSGSSTHFGTFGNL